MCNAFSGIIVRSGKVYWKTGMDGHEDLKEYFNLDDGKLGNICPFEITPENEDYINPDKWIFKFDDGCPEWWKSSHEKHCWSAFRLWKKEVYSKLKMKEIRNLINPFDIKPSEITKKQIRLLKEWSIVWDSVMASVGASVMASVGGSVWASVWASVMASVGDSVWASVGDSIWDSIYSYIGTLFKLKRNEWKYTSKIKTKQYPFLPVVKLWKMGLVPGFDGKIWRLHGGKKGNVLFEISNEDLTLMK